jgi:hypothetical protein
VAGPPLARPTDAPPTAHRSTRGRRRPPDLRAATPIGSCPRRPAAPRRDHHGRQPALGSPARAAEVDGHAAGVEAIRTLLRHAVRRGVPVVTVYAFSRENWARSDDEVRGLFALLEQAIRSETAELKEQGVRIRLLGRLDELPDDTRRSIGERARRDRRRRRCSCNVAFNYAGPDGARRRVPADRRERDGPGDDRRDDRSRTRSTRPACPTPTS